MACWWCPLSVNGIDWGVGEAKALLAEEAAAMADVDELLESVRRGSVQVQAMIAQQEKLKETLLAVPVQVM